MMKMLTMLACVTFAGAASADAPRSPKKAERKAEILRSLDRIELQVVKARQKIDRLEAETKSLREQLIEIASPGTNGVEPASVEVPAARAGTRDVAFPIPDEVIEPMEAFPEGQPLSGRSAADQTKARVFRIGDPNFASPGEKREDEANRGPSGSEYLLIVPPEGNKVVAFDKTTRKSIPMILSGDKDNSHRITPVMGLTIVGLAVKGPKISRLAVFSITTPGSVPAWHGVDLREPVDRAIPDVENYGPVLYTLGHRVYAFSPQAARWDVLELPKGVDPQKGSGSNEGPIIEHDGHIYTFVMATGQWSDLDTNAILGETSDRKPER